MQEIRSISSTDKERNRLKKKYAGSKEVRKKETDSPTPLKKVFRLGMCVHERPDSS
jgi:hypothetical protein